MKGGNGRVALITGASSGIGKACAEHLHQQGWRVYGTSRRAGAPGSAPDGAGGGDAASFELIAMDVTQDDSVRQGVDYVLSKEGRLDVVLNNAGYGLAGAAEETSLAEAKAQFETNYFGAVRVCRAVLPTMRQQRAGHIVNMSSMAGMIAIPFQSMYSASKFALEGYSEALRMEVKSLGIQVSLIQPGDFKTGLTTNRQKVGSGGQESVYWEPFNNSLAVMEADEQNGHTPEPVGHLLEKIINTPVPRLRYTAGPLFEKVAITLKKVLPPPLFEWVLMKYYKLG